MPTIDGYTFRCSLLILVVMSLLAGCGRESIDQVAVMDRPRVSYLEEPVPPCVPVERSGRDPCAVDRPARAESATSDSGWPIWVSSGEMPSYTEVLLGYNYPSITPHIVIRGVPLSGSTRCDLYALEDYSYEVDTLGWSNAYHYYCFSEVAVRDYIVGSGPFTLSVVLHLELLGISEEGAADWNPISGEGAEYLDDPKGKTADAYEGKELVLFLIPALTIEVEAWHALGGSTSFWFVQRRGGEIRVVSPDIGWADTAEERAALDMPLDDLVAKIKAAAVERQKLTGGRVGIASVDGASSGDGEYFPAAQGVRAGAVLPMLVTDANKLQDYYVAAGAVYEGEGKTTVLPPPPPDDFVPPSTTVVSSTTSSVPSSSTTAGSSTTTTLDPSTTTSSTGEVTTTVGATTSTVAATTTSAPTNTTAATTTTSSTTITVAGGVGISVSDASAGEGDGWLVFEVTLSDESERFVGVNYDPRDVTAEDGLDYQGIGGTLLFAPLEVSKSVRIRLRDDSVAEGTETFELVLSQSFGGGSIADAVGTGTIIDND